MRSRNKLSFQTIWTALLVVGGIGFALFKKYEPKVEVVYYPTTENLPITVYKKENFVWGDEFLSYEDDIYTSSIGIDVSTFQDTINWAKVKQAGIEFAYIRIGRRGATTSYLHEDVDFKRNYDGAVNNGIKVGVYFFSQAITQQEAIEEADYCLELLGDRKLDLPIAFDYEESDLEGARTENLNAEQATENAIAFMEELKAKGHKGVIYTNLNWANNMYDLKQLSNYDFWFAQYGTDNPKLKVPFSIWQYTDKGSVEGIDTYVDMDIMFKRKSDRY